MCWVTSAESSHPLSACLRCPSPRCRVLLDAGAGLTDLEVPLPLAAERSRCDVTRPMMTPADACRGATAGVRLPTRLPTTWSVCRRSSSRSQFVRWPFTRQHGRRCVVRSRILTQSKRPTRWWLHQVDFAASLTWVRLAAGAAALVLPAGGTTVAAKTSAPSLCLRSR